ncbi:tripartite tricarboxylate transporter substrate binding protein [Ramlibacter sp. G-1-2-2]|uniref:Tripartite tricarboxylate transporter substrate binding protein n=1 Tax=Ramlibacter agri TaxID=2728837 RepID=A0A848H4B5_9BURK|nr:tripartite tricarboxylate transporter substrate binding protein [Ramlibacter agri]
MRKIIRALAVATAALGLAGAALAQGGWPAGKTVRVIVPFGAGTGLDVMARGFAERLAEQLKTAVVVENREGAGGTVGALAVAHAPADGYTLMFTAHAPFAVAPYLQSGAGYDPVNDFAPVAKVAQIPMVLITGANSRFRSLADVAAYAKANPGKLDYASSGIGTPSHLHMEVIKRELGVDIAAVPYKSTGQAMTDVIGGQLPLYMPSFPAALPQMKAGQVRGLAIGSAKRSPVMPDIPTLAELLKQPNLEAIVWYGFLAPKGTPPEIVERLHAEIAKAEAGPRMKELMDKVGAEAAPAAPREFAQQIQRDAEASRKLLASLGVKAEK